jgi:hypothetical protein
MAKIILSIGGTASGKMGGLVFSHNRFGQYMRQRVRGVNPRTVSQSANRNKFSGASALWQTLGPVIQNQWNALAATVKVKTRKGTMEFITGQNFFVKAEKLWKEFGYASTVNPTAVWNDVELTPATIAAAASSSGPPPVPETFTVTFTGTPPATVGLLVAATPMLSPGRQFMTKSLFRLVSYTVPPVTGPINIDSAYVALFGHLVTGRVIGVRLMFVQMLTTSPGPQVQGQSVWQEFRVVVT